MMLPTFNLHYLTNFLIMDMASSRDAGLKSNKSIVAVNNRNLSVHILGTCNIGGTPLPIHQSVSVKVPQKTADVVVVVEQLEGNQPIFENLLTPLISTLTSDFKEKGIT